MKYRRGRLIVFFITVQFTQTNNTRYPVRLFFFSARVRTLGAIHSGVSVVTPRRHP